MKNFKIYLLLSILIISTSSIQKLFAGLCISTCCKTDTVYNARQLRTLATCGNYKLICLMIENIPCIQLQRSGRNMYFVPSPDEAGKYIFVANSDEIVTRYVKYLKKSGQYGESYKMDGVVFTKPEIVDWAGPGARIRDTSTIHDILYIFVIKGSNLFYFVPHPDDVTKFISAGGYDQAESYIEYFIKIGKYKISDSLYTQEEIYTKSFLKFGINYYIEHLNIEDIPCVAASSHGAKSQDKMYYVASPDHLNKFIKVLDRVLTFEQITSYIKFWKKSGKYGESYQQDTETKGHEGKEELIELSATKPDLDQLIQNKNQNRNKNRNPKQPLIFH